MSPVVILPGALEKMGRGLEARLKTVLPENRFSYRWLPAKMTKTVWQQLTEAMPSVGIQWANFERATTTAGLSGETNWIIYLAIKNAGRTEALLFGDRGSAGILSVLQVAAAAVHGFTLKGIGSFQVREILPVYAEERDEPNLALGAITVQAKADFHLSDLLSGDILNAGTLNETIQWEFDGATVTDIINVGS